MTIQLLATKEFKKISFRNTTDKPLTVFLKGVLPIFFAAKLSEDQKRNIPPELHSDERMPIPEIPSALQKNFHCGQPIHQKQDELQDIELRPKQFPSYKADLQLATHFYVATNCATYKSEEIPITYNATYQLNLCNGKITVKPISD